MKGRGDVKARRQLAVFFRSYLRNTRKQLVHDFGRPVDCGEGEFKLKPVELAAPCPPAPHFVSPRHSHITRLPTKMEPSTSSATAHHASTSPTPSLATNASSTPSLPTEVVSHIVAYATDDLSYTERQSARMRMSLVSRSWYHMMADELNKECVVTESNADRLVEALASKDSEQPIAITGLVLREGKKKKPPPPPPPRREPTPDFGDDDIIIIDPATVEPPKPPPPPPPRPQTQESFALLLTLLSGLKSLTFEAKLDYSTCFDTPNTRFFNALKTLASLQRFVLLEPTQHRLDRCDLKRYDPSYILSFADTHYGSAS